MDRTLDVEGATLAYEVHDGNGPTVVALHGLSSSRASEDVGGYFGWAPVAAAGRRLVRYDARAHGRSTGRPVPEDYAWPNLAHDLFALLDVVSPHDPVDAIGVSMGVGTLLHAAVQRPERFRRLALVIPPTAWSTREAQGGVYRQMADLVEDQGLETLVRAMEALADLPLLEAGGFPSPAAPDVSEALLPSVLRGAAATDLPSSESLRSITVPVLLRPWLDDPGHPVSTSELLHDVLPGATMDVTRTPEDLRALGGRVADFLR